MARSKKNQVVTGVKRGPGRPRKVQSTEQVLGNAIANAIEGSQVSAVLEALRTQHEVTSSHLAQISARLADVEQTLNGIGHVLEAAEVVNSDDTQGEATNGAETRSTTPAA